MTAEQDVLNEALSIVLTANDAFFVELAAREGTDAWCAQHPEAAAMPENMPPVPTPDESTMTVGTGLLILIGVFILWWGVTAALIVGIVHGWGWCTSALCVQWGFLALLFVRAIDERPRR